MGLGKRLDAAEGTRQRLKNGVFRGVGGVICRVKIDHLDRRKPYTKYIWGGSPLQMEFNEPIRAVKVINFNISHVET